ncbi:MAG: guanylate kinase [Bacteroidales bacterium]|nr:guanylate kinase [Bacteroidales bacterium]
MKGKLIVFSAPSGSGKTTIVKALLKRKEFKFEFSVSATSRNKREKEKNGIDYYFLSVADFKKKIKGNAFVEWEEVYANQFYGTLHSEVERIRNNENNVIFDIDVAGGLNIKKKYKDECLTVFIMTPSIEELEKRLKKRGTETEASLKKRISKAKYEMTFSKDFGIIIINDKLETAIEETINNVREFLTS